MKKAISLLLLIAVMSIMFSGCSIEADNLIGTWKASSIEADGVKYTIPEIEAMGDDSTSDMQIVIKDGGKACLIDSVSSDIVDWEKTDSGIKIGEADCTIVDGMICIEYGACYIYFIKISDSQIIGATQNSNNTQDMDE